MILEKLEIDRRVEERWCDFLRLSDAAAVDDQRLAGDEGCHGRR